MLPTDLLNKANRVIAVSNLTLNANTELKLKQYDCIVRFNKGSNPLELSLYPDYNGIVDVCVLSGWKKGDFGNLEGFVDKPILFGRPKYYKNIIDYLQVIAVKPAIHNSIINYTSNIQFIPEKIYHDFVKHFKYYHPTTGLITLFYIKEYCNKNLECINFLYINNMINNIYTNITDHSNHSHDLCKEQEILKKLNITNHILC